MCVLENNSQSQVFVSQFTTCMNSLSYLCMFMPTLSHSHSLVILSYLSCFSPQILDVRNVMVVVSRWYGGILLGPDRFKHINNCARNILVEEGYTASTVRHAAAYCIVNFHWYIIRQSWPQFLDDKHTWGLNYKACVRTTQMCVGLCPRQVGSIRVKLDLQLWPMWVHKVEMGLKDRPHSEVVNWSDR